MIFVYHIKTLHNTPSTDPLITEIPLLLGTIQHVEVQFPPGCNALAHLIVRFGLYQLFPSNQDSDFATGGETIDWDENLAIDAEPAQLTAESWNEDTVYDHTITLRIMFQPAPAGPNVQQTISQLFAQQTPSPGGS